MTSSPISGPISRGYIIICVSVWWAEFDWKHDYPQQNKSAKLEFLHLFLTAAATVCDQRTIVVHLYGSRFWAPTPVMSIAQVETTKNDLMFLHQSSILHMYVTDLARSGVTPPGMTRSRASTVCSARSRPPGTSSVDAPNTDCRRRPKRLGRNRVFPVYRRRQYSVQCACGRNVLTSSVGRNRVDCTSASRFRRDSTHHVVLKSSKNARNEQLTELYSLGRMIST